MRILRAIVLPEPLLMRAGQLQLPERRTIGAQLVGHQQFRHKPLLSEKLAHQPQRRPGVAASVDEHVEDLAFVVDGTPEVHPACRRSEQPSRPGAIDRSGGDGAAAAARDQGGQISAPSAAPFHRRGQAHARPAVPRRLGSSEGQAEIQPDRVLDDLGREAMTAVGEPGHLAILPGTVLSRLRFRDSASGRALPGGCAGRGRACRRQSPRPSR